MSIFKHFAQGLVKGFLITILVVGPAVIAILLLNLGATVGRLRCSL